MNTQTFGQLAALGTALCWAVTSTSFESAGKRVGSFQVNLIRLVVAFLIFTLYSMVVYRQPLPLQAGGHVWIWLSLSGLVGFVFGDLFLFQAFVDVGARTAMLVYSLVPPMTALLGRIILKEVLTPLQLVGMVITVVGIMIVVTGQSRVNQLPHPHRLRGIWFAVLGALGQALGLVLGRYGAPSYDPFGATQIRALAGVVGFAVLFTVMRRWRRVYPALSDRPAMRSIIRGAFFGPFLGVTLALFAAQRTGTGIASTLTATVPVILIPVAIFRKKETVAFQEILGAVVAVGGVAVLFLA
ncbi:MAG: DMT family transporter [Alkalispirochaeta sp.]